MKKIIKKKKRIEKVFLRHRLQKNEILPPDYFCKLRYMNFQCVSFSRKQVLN